MDTKVVVVTHKEYQMPKEDIYVPVCVGVGVEKLKDKYQPDNQGENISDKNPMYCELTALYWAWKNLQCDVFGLVHYRRHLTLSKKGKELKDVLTEKEITELLKEHDVIVAKRRTYPETVKRHYIKCQKGQAQKADRRIGLLGEVIQELSPEYAECFHKVMNGHQAHMFNIFIMKKADADAFCEWMFQILFETEKRILAEGVQYERQMGELSEFLLDVWMKTNNKKWYEARVIQYGYSFYHKVRFVVCRRLFGKIVK